MIKFQFHQIALVADIEKAFLMVGIREEDRDMLRFLWLKEPFKLDSDTVSYRFTRLVFGLCRGSRERLPIIMSCIM